ncbi:MAG: alkaline phosphatase family protein [Chlorobi bacterium]|nr:alkaline phosphatase family protein [Chlorobiota bacterium]
MKTHSLSRRITVLFLTLFIWAVAVSAQHERNGVKLVVVIAIDQFRADYLTRFAKSYSDSGFKLLMRRGAWFTNARFEHANTSTAPGHATISTGCYAGNSGIVGNSWYDLKKKRSVYCVLDPTVRLVGSEGMAREGQRSPANLLVPGLGDYLKSASPESRVISLSIKDRAAILLGGKKPDEVFWYSSRTGKLITSSYYMATTPVWIQALNAMRIPDTFFGKDWDYLLPEKQYSRCDADDVPYEGSPFGLGRTFPHPMTAGLTKPGPDFYSALRFTPFSNQLLVKAAKMAVLTEKLGMRGYTDLLMISFSSIDYIGHTWGPDSREIMDACVRTDRDLAALLTFLQREVGLSNCLVVLTSDHGVAPIPEHEQKRRRKAGRIFSTEFKRVTHALDSVFGTPPRGKRWFKAVSFPNFYLDRSVLVQKGLSLPEFEKVFRRAVLGIRGIAAVYSRTDLQRPTKKNRAVRLMFNPERSGDYYVVQRKGWVYTYGDSKTGTGHGSPYDYDAHVPLIFFSPRLKRGTYRGTTGISSLAPTVGKLLGIEIPSCDGKPLRLALRKLKR